MPSRPAAISARRSRSESSTRRAYTGTPRVSVGRTAPVLGTDGRSCGSWYPLQHRADVVQWQNISFPKLNTRVRFPSSAPRAGAIDGFRYPVAQSFQQTAHGSTDVSAGLDRVFRCASYGGHCLIAESPSGAPPTAPPAGARAPMLEGGRGRLRCWRGCTGRELLPSFAIRAPQASTTRMRCRGPSIAVSSTASHPARNTDHGSSPRSVAALAASRTRLLTDRSARSNTSSKSAALSAKWSGPTSRGSRHCDARSHGAGLVVPALARTTRSPPRPAVRVRPAFPLTGDHTGCMLSAYNQYVGRTSGPTISTFAETGSSWSRTPLFRSGVHPPGCAECRAGFGSGPPVVLWRSLWSIRAWVPSDAFAEHRRVVTIDGPSYGRSSPIRRDFTLDDCAAAAVGGARSARSHRARWIGSATPGAGMWVSPFAADQPPTTQLVTVAARSLRSVVANGGRKHTHSR